jgi:hypothetical protein
MSSIFIGLDLGLYIRSVEACSEANTGADGVQLSEIADSNSAQPNLRWSGRFPVPPIPAKRKSRSRADKLDGNAKTSMKKCDNTFVAI